MYDAKKRLMVENPLRRYKIGSADELKTDADGTTTTGASKIGLGVYRKLDKTAKVYIAYGSVDNDTGATFQAVDGGHGDEVKTTTGGDPSSLSVGIEYKF